MAANAPRLILISARDLGRRAFPPTAFVVPGIVPVGLTILAGRPKVGKSWAALGMAVAVASGGTFLGRKASKGAALYLALEDNDARLQRRQALVLGDGEPPENLHFATTCPPLDGDRAGAVAAIRAWAADADRPLLVVIDVLQRIRPPADRSARLYADDYGVTLPLKRLADELGIAVVVITHTRKSSGEDGADPIDQVSGTLGLTGAADHIMVLDRGAHGYLLHCRGRDAEELDLALSFDPARGTWDALGDAADVGRSETRLLILNALRRAPGPLSPADVAAETGLAAGTVRVRLRAMLGNGDVIQTTRGTYGLPGGPILSDIPTAPRNKHNTRNNDQGDGDNSYGSDGGVMKAGGRHAPRAAHLNGTRVPDHDGIAVPRAPPS
ncbi:MAG: AAA family ATPase [Phreatobacter sp.]|nr:AAA family ATPase [Phreatobacter sp.]